MPKLQSLNQIDHGVDVLNLTAAVNKYFDLMHDCDTSKFDEVFVQTVHLHGVRDGELRVWPAEVYRDTLRNRESPKSRNEPRDSQILLVDFASPRQALVKVRVRISDMVFVDHLTYHQIDGKWLITSKGFDLQPQ